MKPTRLHFLSLTLALTLGLSWGSAARAQSLVDLFGAARQYDANYRGALAQYEANRAKADRVFAGLLPSVNLTF